MTTPGEVRNVAVLGHKGAGKTSLVEAALYRREGHAEARATRATAPAASTTRRRRGRT